MSQRSVRQLARLRAIVHTRNSAGARLRVLAGWRGEPCGVVGTDELGRRCQIAGTYTFCAQEMYTEKTFCEDVMRRERERSERASSTMPKCHESHGEAPEGMWSFPADGTYSPSAGQAFSSKTDTEHREVTREV